MAATSIVTAPMTSVLPTPPTVPTPPNVSSFAAPRLARSRLRPRVRFGETVAPVGHLETAVIVRGQVDPVTVGRVVEGGDEVVVCVARDVRGVELPQVFQVRQRVQRAE